MRRRSKAPRDSLDLLLDTMCNAFGGIVLIAILVALLVEKPGDDSRKSPASGKEALEQMRRARELKELEAEVEQLHARWEKDRGLIEQIQLRDRLAQTLANRQQNSALSMVELNERVVKALEEKVTLLEDVTRTRRQLAGLEASIEENRMQITSLEGKMEELVSNRMSETRPPELRDASGMQYNLIIRYGEIFPLNFLEFNASGDIHSVTENDTSLRWDGPIVEPVRGQGLTIANSRESIKSLILSLSRYNAMNAARPTQRIHIAIFVYGDSFETIDPLRALIDEAGNIAHGWEPWESDAPLGFSSDGRKSQVE